MDAKRFAIGTVVGGIAMYLVGYLMWNIVFDYWNAAFDAAGVALSPNCFGRPCCRMSWLLPSSHSLLNEVVPRRLERASRSARL